MDMAQGTMILKEGYPHHLYNVMDILHGLKNLGRSHSLSQKKLILEAKNPTNLIIDLMKIIRFILGGVCFRIFRGQVGWKW